MLLCCFALSHLISISVSRKTLLRPIISMTSVKSYSILENLNFDNRNLKNLPVNDGPRNVSRIVKNAIFSYVDLQPVKNPVLISLSPSAMSLLGIPFRNQKDYSINELNQMASYLAGNELIPGSQPAAHVYCGHQFGSFAGQLGDGAAMYLGEVINNTDQSRWELQIKGAGLTPFSRTADGRKVLRSSIREFLCSEAMHFLNIPTTRAGSVVMSDSTVERDPFYDGNSLNEPCAIVSRIAPNFFRFGSFEIFKAGTSEYRAGPSAGNESLKKQLLDHILLYYPGISSSFMNQSQEEVYSKLLEEIVRRTAILVAKWQGVGFVHGVLNTDNMSIMGLTIDYGPFGFMEHFDPDFTPNGSDNSGRYSYQNQEKMCRWNLQRLAEMFHPFVQLEKGMGIVDKFNNMYESEYVSIMSAKLGLPSSRLAGEVEEGVHMGMYRFIILIEGLVETMAATYADFTDTFRALTDFVEELDVAIGDDEAEKKATRNVLDKLVSRCATPSDLSALLKRKLRVHRLGMHPQQLLQLLHILEHNPEEIVSMFDGAPIEVIRYELQTEQNKLEQLSKVSNMLNDLNTKSAEDGRSGENTLLLNKRLKDEGTWHQWIEKYLAVIKHIKATSNDKSLSESVISMRANNPTFILRNWIAQEAILAAEKRDFTKVQTVLRMLSQPFKPEYSVFHRNMQCNIPSLSASLNDVFSEAEAEFIRVPPDWADGLLCTCSS